MGTSPTNGSVREFNSPHQSWPQGQFTHSKPTQAKASADHRVGCIARGQRLAASKARKQSRWVQSGNKNGFSQAEHPARFFRAAITRHQRSVQELQLVGEAALLLNRSERGSKGILNPNRLLHGQSQEETKITKKRRPSAVAQLKQTKGRTAMAQNKQNPAPLRPRKTDTALRKSSKCPEPNCSNTAKAERIGSPTANMTKRGSMMIRGSARHSKRTWT